MDSATHARARSEIVAALLAATVPPYTRITASELLPGDRLVSGGVIAATGRASLTSIAVDVELEDEPGVTVPRTYPDDLTVLVHEPRPAPVDADERHIEMVGF